MSDKQLFDYKEFKHLAIAALLAVFIVPLSACREPKPKVKIEDLTAEGYEIVGTPKLNTILPSQVMLKKGESAYVCYFKVTRYPTKLSESCTKLTH